MYSYKPHSTRAASTSKAQNHGVLLNLFLNIAGSTNADEFTKFYKIDIKEIHSVQFQSAVLDCTKYARIKISTIIMSSFIVIFICIGNLTSREGLHLQKMKLNN